MAPPQEQAELRRHAIVTLGMAAIGVILLVFQEEPAAGRQAAAAAQMATTTLATTTVAVARAAPPVGEVRLEPARGERGLAPAATPFEAAPCLYPVTGQAGQRYRRFTRPPPHGEASDFPVFGSTA
jgi:hypothetical protein